MNSKQNKTTLIITSILALALLANLNVGAIYATGSMNDEEEEAAIYALQDAIEEIQGTLVEEAPTCPPALTNTTTTTEPEQNVTGTTEQGIIPEIVLPPVEINETIVTEEPVPTNNITAAECPVCPECPSVEEVVEPEQNVTEQNNNNVTEVIQEIIENVTGVEVEVEQNNVTEIITITPTNTTAITEENELPICNITTTAVPAEQENNVTETAPIVVGNLTDNGGQEIASIEFDVSCNCFIVEKTPEAAPQE